MKLAVVGSRDFNNYDMLKLFLDSYRNNYNELIIISGGAKGADKLAEKYAKENNIEIKVFLADWNGPHKKAAGFIRNTKIVEEADEILAFWNGESRGTLDTINKAKKFGKKLLEVKYRELL